MAPPRTGKRLILRPVATDDLDALRYYQDPEVCRYLPFPVADDAALAARVAMMTQRSAPSEPDDVLSLAVVHEDALVGDLILRLRSRIDDQSPPGVAEIGWAFAPSYVGRGFATEAATALVDLAFRHYPLHRLCAYNRQADLERRDGVDGILAEFRAAEHLEPDMLRLVECFATERALLEALLRNHERIVRVLGEWQAGQGR